MSLLELKNGQKFKILKVNLKGEIGKRLADMGFINGAKAEIVRSALLGDPIEIKLIDCHISIRKSEAAGIEIQEIA